MSNQMKFAIGGVVVGLVLLFFLPDWVGIVIIAAAIGLPIAAYLMLDPSQRRRLREARRRQIRR
jgi:hypothetical protein